MAFARFAPTHRPTNRANNAPQLRNNRANNASQLHNNRANSAPQLHMNTRPMVMQMKTQTLGFSQQRVSQVFKSFSAAPRTSSLVRFYGSGSGSGHSTPADITAVFKKVAELDKKMLNHTLDPHTANEKKFQYIEQIKPDLFAVHKERSELGYHYAADGKRVFTREEVASHNTDTDLWVIVDDKVFNVSTWLEYHPGGMEVLRQNAGKDASEKWHNVGHSYRAREAMEIYHIGYVNTPRRFSGLSETEPPRQFT